MNVSIPALRPLNLADLLDTTFALYRRNFALFAGIVAILTIPQTFIDALLQLVTPQATSTSASGAVTVNAGDLVAVLILGGARGLIGLIFGTLITGALAQAISARYLGREITIEQAYMNVGVRMFVILLLASILQAIIVALGFILLVIPGVYLLVRYLFISQAIVLEHKGIGGAFSRSGELVRGSWWRVFGIGLVLFLLVAVIQQAGGGVIVGILSLGKSTTGHLIGDAVNAVVRIIVLPIELGGLTLLYYDLRIRKEGFDLQQMAQTLGRTPPGP